MPRARDVADPLWPSTLRSWRTKRGLSMRQLAARVHVGKSTVCRLEAGTRTPSLDIAARLDEVLETGGELAALVTAGTEDDGRLAHALTGNGRIDAATVGTLTTRLAEYRALEDEVGAAAMLPTAAAHLTMMEDLLRQAYGPHRAGLVCVGAQWAQWNGWLHLAQDHIRTGAASLDRALEWATESTDEDLTATVLSFKGYAAEHASAPGPMIGLTEAALRRRHVYIGQRAYDEYQLARGYVLLGEHVEAHERLTKAEDLAAEAVADDGDRPPWHYYRTQAFFSLEAGLVLRQLDKMDPAAERLAAGLAGLPADQRDSEWTAPYRRALADAAGMSPDALGTRAI